MFQLLALNPPAGGRVGKKRPRKGKSGSKKKMAHRTPRHKSGPKKGQFMSKKSVAAKRARSGSKRKSRKSGKTTGFRRSMAQYLQAKRKRAQASRSARKSAAARAQHMDLYGYNNPPRRKRRSSKRRKNPGARKRKGRYGSYTTKIRFVRLKGGRVKVRKNKRRRKSPWAGKLVRLNPRRRRKHSNSGKRRRHRNPGRKSSSKGFSIAGFKLGSAADYAFDGAAVGAGLALAFALPVQIAGMLKKPELNRGWAGVALSGVSAAVASFVLVKAKQPRMAKLVGIGGALAAIIKAGASLAPKQISQYIAQPISAAAGGQPMMIMGPPAPVGKGSAAYGDSPFFTPSQIIRGEAGRGMKDWLQMPGAESYGFSRGVQPLGMSDWVNMDVAPRSTVTGNESF